MKVWDLAGGPEKANYEKDFVPHKFNVPGKENVHRLGLRKTKATIYVRPEYNKETDTFAYNEKKIDWDKIFKLRDEVDGWFPGLSFKKKNVKQFHHASCDYEPYERMMKHMDNKALEK